MTLRGIRRSVEPAALAAILALLVACGRPTGKEQAHSAPAPAPPVYFHVNPATAGTLRGRVRFTGKRPPAKLVDMSDEPACVTAHHGRAYNDPVAVGRNGGLANVFLYVKSGLEGKTFAPPSVPVTIDQRGCWFTPRVIGIQTGQPLEVVNSDPVTHNIHPQAQINREWNHSQGAGDPPILRRFLHPEIMIPVKCNIHSWMHAYIGVVDNPYFAVSAQDGSFEISNLPPGDYTIAAWQEALGTQEQRVVIPPSGTVALDFTFRGK